MKIECPSCHLTGNINEVELPPQGRRIGCPRCKHDFQVEKPAAPPPGTRLMSTCPACQYSTFTEETFAVCPKCGTTAEQHQALARRQQERQQSQRDQEALTRSYRNPELAAPQPEPQAREGKRPDRPVELTAFGALAAGSCVFLYGVAGLVKYYERDWQAVLSEPVLEPVSTFYVFAHLGLVPWLAFLVGLYISWAAYGLLKLKEESPRRLAEAACAAIATAFAYQAVNFYDWIRISSGAPTLSYYAVGILNALVMGGLMAAPFAALLLMLRSDRITRDFRRARLHP